MSETDPVVGPIRIEVCRRCGWKTLTEGGLCEGCREASEWSRVNRAFNALLRERSDGHDPQP